MKNIMCFVYKSFKNSISEGRDLGKKNSSARTRTRTKSTKSFCATITPRKNRLFDYTSGKVFCKHFAFPINLIVLQMQKEE